MKAPVRMTIKQLEQIAALTKEGLQPYEISKKLKIDYTFCKYHVGNLFLILLISNMNLKRKNKSLLEMVTNQFAA